MMDLCLLEKNLKSHLKEHAPNAYIALKTNHYEGGIFGALVSGLLLPRNEELYLYNLSIVTKEDDQFIFFSMDFQHGINKDADTFEKINAFNGSFSTLSATIGDNDDGSHCLTLNYTFPVLDETNVPIERFWDIFFYVILQNEENLQELDALLALLYDSPWAEAASQAIQASPD